MSGFAYEESGQLDRAFAARQEIEALKRELQLALLYICNQYINEGHEARVLARWPDCTPTAEQLAEHGGEM